MSDAQNKEIVRRVFDEYSDGRQLDLADELMTSDCVYHDPQIPNVGGPEAMTGTIALVQNAIGGHWHIEQLIAAENDHVICRWTGTGNHVGDFAGLPPTGKSFRVDAISVLRIADGKIAEHWACWDTLGFMQQIGVVPTPGQAPD